MDAARITPMLSWSPPIPGPGRTGARNPSRAEARPDIWFVDLPHATSEFGRQPTSLVPLTQFVVPGEVNIGFRYMTAALERAGFEALILYPSADGPSTPDDLIDEIVRGRPRVVGLATNEGSLRETLDFVHVLRARGATSLICLSGHVATFSYREIMTDFPDLVDVIVLGEGEQTVVELVAALRSGAPFGAIAGLAYREGTQVRRSATRPTRQDLDSLPNPVIITSPEGRAEGPLSVATSRGCYARCTFCRSSHLGERWRPRDPVAVVDEIERAQERGVRLFELVDDNFFGPGRRGRRRATAFAGELLRRGLNVRFHASCRVDDVDEMTMIALREAGLISLSVGVESGVPRVLEMLGKNVTAEKNETTLQLLDRLGIPTLASIIFFDPYTTLNEVRENVTFLERISLLRNVRFEESIFSRLTPINGTTLFKSIREDGLLRGNYLSGYSFAFRDERVRLLADFVGTVDIGMERMFRDAAYRNIPELYTAMRERAAFDLVIRAVDYLENHPDYPGNHPEGSPGTEPVGAEAGLAQVWQEVFQEHVTSAGARR